MSTQVETRLLSARPRRSLLPGPKIVTGAAKTKVRCSGIPSPTSPSSGFKHLQIGQEVTTSDGKVGVLRFKGKTHFTQGFFCGIELYHALGKNDGSVDGIYYFECLEPHGLFVPAYKVFPSGPANAGCLAKPDKGSSGVADAKGQRKYQTVMVTSKRLPRPKTLPFPEGAIQRGQKLKASKSGPSGSQAKRSSGSVKLKGRQSLPGTRLPNRRVSPLSTSLTCPGWLDKEASKPSTSQAARRVLNDTFTIPGEGETNLGRGLSTSRTDLNEAKNGCEQSDAAGGKPRGRLDSVPSCQNLSSVGGSDEELGTGTPTRPDIVEDCQSRANRTYDVNHDQEIGKDAASARALSPVMFAVGSQGSLEAWEDNSVSCGKSNSSLAWDFDIPAASTPVGVHLAFDMPKRKVQQSEEDEDYVSTDDEIEYNEFLAIPSYLDTPTGRCKFDLLTPEELERALNEVNFGPDGPHEHPQQDDEPLLNLSNIQRTPIWEPITPVEEEFLPFASGSNLDPNPLAFWSMDSVPVKNESVSEQEQLPDTQSNGGKREFVATTEITLENAGCPEQEGHSVEGGILPSGTAGVEFQGITGEQPPFDLLESIRSVNETVLVEKGTEETPKSSDHSPVMIELVMTNSNSEYSDSSSCSTKTVKENISGLEKLVDNVTDDLKIALKESEITGSNVAEIQIQSLKKEEDPVVPGVKKPLEVEQKLDTKTTRKPTTRTGTKLTKDKVASNDAVRNNKQKPPVPPKLSVIPRRRTLGPCKVSTKAAEVRSKIDTRRRSLDSNPTAAKKDKVEPKENATAGKKDVKATKRTPLQLGLERDRTRKQSSSSAASDNSRGSGSLRSVSSSRPSSVKSNGSTEAKRTARKSVSPAPKNLTRKPARSSALSTQPRMSQKNGTTSAEPAPTRRTGPGARKPMSSTDGTKSTTRKILSNDPKQAKLRKTQLPSGASTPPDVVYASIPDVHTNEEIKRLEMMCSNQAKQLDAACQQVRVNAKAFETMAVLVQYLTEKCDALAVPALKKKINLIEEQVKETSTHVAGLEKEIIRQGQELSESKKYQQQQQQVHELGAGDDSQHPGGEQSVGDSAGGEVECAATGSEGDPPIDEPETAGSGGLRGEPEGEQQMEPDNDVSEETSTCVGSLDVTQTHQRAISPIDNTYETDDL